mmetsp:Transcript_25230/g.54345  ORF Transcript_25230/g.54345 Transcript_25230/m.54345 type:complete len:236 (+) Transcript_25230:108-815(+)
MGEVDMKRLLGQQNVNRRFRTLCHSSRSIAMFLLALFLVDYAHGFSPAGMDRSRFLEHAVSRIIGNTIAVSSITASIMVSSPSNAIAIDFVPASPYFSGTYQDAVEIMYAQRVAVDNIADVMKDGNTEEAGFKVMQLSAQTRMAGKIILDTFQEGMAGNNGDSVLLLRFLSCQRKFAMLLDLCDDCDDSLQIALRRKSGSGAAAEIKSLSIVEETKSAYDDFLADLKTFEKAIEK